MHLVQLWNSYTVHLSQLLTLRDCYSRVLKKTILTAELCCQRSTMHSIIMNADYSDCGWTRNFWEILFISNTLTRAVWMIQNTDIFPQIAFRVPASNRFYFIQFWQVGWWWLIYRMVTMLLCDKATNNLFNVSPLTMRFSILSVTPSSSSHFSTR